MNILTIDIGGTAIKSAFYNEAGELIRDLPVINTAVTETDNHILEQVVELVATVKDEIDGVAVASAGVIDPVAGKVVYAGPTIPNYIGTEIAATITKTFDLPCSVENDVNAAALGEYWRGAAQGSHSTLCITLGTGVGGAVLLGGELWRGYTLTAGEMGYLPIDEHGLTLQEVASTSGILAAYEAKTGLTNVSGKLFFDRVRSGDADACAMMETFVKTLARGLLPAIYLFAPQMLIIGGGITHQRDILEPRIQAELEKQIQAPRFLPEKVCCAELRNHAGMIGALRHFLNQHG